jgi:hypothetical protein
MTYPPDGCTYEVVYMLGRRGSSTEAFSDELKLMDWFRAMTAKGAFTPAEFREPDEDGRNGYQIYCVTDTGKIGISYFHPRMVRARIERSRYVG